MFFRGVVENDADPLNLQRVQIRVLGIHSDDPNDVPTDCLPWAEPALPITNGKVDGGYGVMDTPSIGDWVWLFFEDEWKQLPHYFAVIRTVKDINRDFKQPLDRASSKINEKLIRNRVERDRWENKTITSNDEFQRTDTWKNKLTIDKDQESYEDHFGNKITMNNDEIVIENKATAKVKMKSNGDIEVWSGPTGTISIGNNPTSSSVNWTNLSVWMTSIETAIMTHTHLNILGLPTPPDPATIPAVVQPAQQVKPMVESKKIKISGFEDI